jgi:hypothetical protein
MECENQYVSKEVGIALTLNDSNWGVFQESAKEIVTAGGGEYKGIQRGTLQTPDLILFNDPVTGTTLALAADRRQITVARIQAKIARSRARIAQYGRFNFRGNYRKVQ